MQYGGTLVVPSRQRAEAVRLAFAAAALSRQANVWSTPDVLPFETWRAREVARVIVSQRSAPRLLSTAEEWWLWRKASETVASDFELMGSATLADALRRSDELAFEYGLDVRNLAARGVEQALLARASRAVREAEDNLGVGSAARLAPNLPVLGDARPLLFAGFLSLTPAIRAVIDSRRARGFETYVAELDAAVEIPAARYFSAEDAADELEQIAAWTRARIAQQADARLLIVLPGALAQRQRLATLIHQSLDAAGFMRREAATEWVALEGGSPLSAQPLIAHALTSLQILHGGTDFETASEWLRSPYWRSDAGGRARLDAWLCQHADIEQDAWTLRRLLESVPRALEGTARGLIACIDRALHEFASEAATPRQWSERMHAALDAIGWPGERPLSSEEQQTVNRLFELLKEFGGLGAVAPRWSRSEALSALRELCTRTAFSPASGDVPVTISPLLADPIIRYDGIWVAGLTADLWPPAPSVDPFLPVEAQRRWPGATTEGRLMEARSLMRAWRLCSDQLVLSAAKRSGDIELTPSPLLAEIQAAPAVRVASGWLAQAVRRAGALESLVDTSGSPFAAGARLPGGTYVLQVQNDCPFHAYATFRLGCEDRRPPAPGVEPDIRGRLLHGALEQLWRTVRDSQTLSAMDEGARRALIEKSIDAAVIDLWGGAPSTPPQKRERARAARLIFGLCELERTRPGFAVRDIEREQLLKLAGAELSVRIDRVDTLESGGLAILDYKSGRPGKAEWYEPRPSHVQLMAYLAATEGDVRALATVHLTAREIRFSGISASAKLLPKVREVQGQAQRDDDGGASGQDTIWLDRTREWLACLERLAHEFVNGYAAVDPKPLACLFCPVDSLCRIAESPLPIDDALIESGVLDE